MDVPSKPHGGCHGSTMEEPWKHHGSIVPTWKHRGGTSEVLMNFSKVDFFDGSNTEAPMATLVDVAVVPPSKHQLKHHGNDHRCTVPAGGFPWKSHGKCMGEPRKHLPEAMCFHCSPRGGSFGSTMETVHGRTLESKRETPRTLCDSMEVSMGNST